MLVKADKVVINMDKVVAIAIESNVAKFVYPDMAFCFAYDKRKIC